MKELLINQFKDSEGHVWTFGITVGSYMKVKSETGFDISNISSSESWIANFAAAEDLSSIITMAVIVLEKQLEAANLDIEGFMERLGAEQIEPMVEAMLGGVVNFTPAHKREPVLKSIMLMKMQAEKLSNLSMDQLNDLEEAIQNQTPQQMLSHLEELKKQSSSQQES